MPIYDYQCPKCDITEERLVWNSEKEEQTCETCGSKMNRMLDISTVHFRAFPEQMIEAIDPHKPISSFRELRRKARSWENDKQRKLSVDCTPTQQERRRKLATAKDRNHQSELRKKTPNLVQV